MTKESKEKTKTLSSAEIVELVSDVKTCFDFIASLKSARPTAEYIQRIKIPPMLSESIVCDLIRRNEILGDLRVTEVRRTGGQKMPDITAITASRELKVEVKGTGSSGFQEFGRKDISCDVLVWLDFGIYFQSEEEVEIKVCIVREPAAHFQKKGKIGRARFLEAKPELFLFKFSEKYGRGTLRASQDDSQKLRDALQDAQSGERESLIQSHYKMAHVMKLSAEPFGKIARKEKVIESRLFDEKRQQISLGDEIDFSENDHPEHVVKTRVTGLLRYPTFEKLFAASEPSLFGGESRESLLNQIKQFYSDEDEMKYGVVGICIEIID